MYMGVEFLVHCATLELIRLKEGQGKILPLAQVKDANAVEEVTHIPDTQRGPCGFILLGSKSSVYDEQFTFSVYRHTQEGKPTEWLVEKKWIHSESWKSRGGILYRFARPPGPPLIFTLYTAENSMNIPEGQDGFIDKHYM